MQLTYEAEKYVLQRGIKPVPVYSAKRYAATMGDTDPRKITQCDLRKFADTFIGPTSTVRGTIKDVITVCRSVGNTQLQQCIRKPMPEPDPTPISSIEAAWQFLAPWSCSLVALIYWTGLRLDDAINLQLRGIDLTAESIRWQASKTSRAHIWPMAGWLAKWMQPCRLPYSKSNDHAQTIVRGELDRVATIGHVGRIYPQQLRQRSITEWTRANATAGAIVHGSGLGVMAHYLDPLSVLESAGPRVRLPKCFGACVDDATEATLLVHFRRLDPAAQHLVAGTAERLSAG